MTPWSQEEDFLHIYVSQNKNFYSCKVVSSCTSSTPFDLFQCMTLDHRPSRNMPVAISLKSFVGHPVAQPSADVLGFDLRTKLIEWGLPADHHPWCVCVTEPIARLIALGKWKHIVLPYVHRTHNAFCTQLEFPSATWRKRFSDTSVSVAIFAPKAIGSLFWRDLHC